MTDYSIEPDTQHSFSSRSSF